MPGRRLEVEAWRDSMLAVTDKLDLTIGGPSVPLSSPDNHRRTFYAAVSRHDLDSMLRLFDFPDPNVTADARMATTVPLQQLFVLNSEFMIRQAKAFAARLTCQSGAKAMPTASAAPILLAYNRRPTDTELRWVWPSCRDRNRRRADTGGALSSSATASRPPPRNLRHARFPLGTVCAGSAERQRIYVY